MDSLSWLYDFDKVLLGVAGSWRKYHLPVALHKKQSDVDGWQKKAYAASAFDSKYESCWLSVYYIWDVMNDKLLQLVK